MGVFLGFIAGVVSYMLTTFVMEPIVRYRDVRHQILRDLVMYANVLFDMRAAARFEKNTTAPFVKVRIAGREFDNVRAEPAPEMVERVAAAMAAKYWSDLLIRFASHPLTVAVWSKDGDSQQGVLTSRGYWS